MVRTVTATRTLQKGQRIAFLPGATEAEPWEAWALGANPQVLEVCQKPGAMRPNGPAILALPIAQVFCLPLWLNETDEKEFRGMIDLQLEARGLRPRGQDPIFNWSVVARESARTLVLIAVLPATLPEELETDACQTFDVAARFFPLPPNTLVLWREQDRLVAAMTRDDHLAYFHALSEPTLGSRALQDLTCLCASLQMQEVLDELRQVVLWMDAKPAELAALKTAFALPVRQEPRPAPRPPLAPWNLTPARVDQAKRGRVARRWQFRALGLVILCVLLTIAAFGTRLFLASIEVSRLQRWSTEHAPALQLVHDTEAEWKDLQPVVDQNSYPLEILLHVSESVPVDQLHLTLFETSADHVLIKAEAKNLTAAFQLLDKLKKDPHFAGYTWDMAQPHSLANDVTQLQIEGTHATHD
jgi:hypothetical protein